MISTLVVKNFGPLKDINITLKNVNVFIGAQASGKSTLAKIFTIFKAPRKFIETVTFDELYNETFFDYEKSFTNILDEYNIASFLQIDTEIRFESELHTLIYQEGKFSYNPKILRSIRKLEGYRSNVMLKRNELIEGIKKISENLLLFKVEVGFKFKEQLGWKEQNQNITSWVSELDHILNENTFDIILDCLKDTELRLSENAALYIPAERNFISIVLASSMSIMLKGLSIPKHLLAFGTEIQNSDTKKIDLDILRDGLSYEQIDGSSYVFTEGSKIRLDQASSGVQSVIPILIPILSHGILRGHRSFVIEEPEQNIFPSAQYALIKMLESLRRDFFSEDAGTIHTYTTHSPFILSAINNLLYAHKLKYSKSRDLMDNVEEIIGSASIYPKHFVAYQLKDGSATSIYDEESGLIDENFIDESSDLIADDFANLVNLALND